MLRTCKALLIALIAAAWIPTPAQASVVVDNADGSPTFTTTGSWSTGSKAGQVGSSSSWASTDNNGATATFTPNLPAAGVYGVEMNWPSGSNAAWAQDGQLTLNHADGSANYYVDQVHATTGSTWVAIAIAGFDAGSSGNLVASETATAGRINADAARFTQATAGNDELVGMTFAATPRLASAVYSETGTGWIDNSVEGHATNVAGDTAVYYMPDLIQTDLITSVTLKITEYSFSQRGNDHAFNIYDGGTGTSPIASGTLDQSGSDSSVLGTYTFTSGRPAIEFIASGNNYMGAGLITMELVDYELVPEPGTLALLGFGGLAAALRRRRRHG